jgi:hypothetical protein
MTGVLAIQCNVQTSFAARQKLLVSFDRFQEPIEPVDQLEGGAWRLYTSSAVKLDVPKGRRKQSQCRLSAALVWQHGQGRGQAACQEEEWPASADIQVDRQCWGG